METPPSDFPAEPVRLEGQGLVLREWGESDLPDLAELYDDPEISRWTPVASPCGPMWRALGLATRYASGRLRARRVLLRIEAGNLASTAVARSAGFRLTGDALLVREVKGRRVALQTWCHRPSR
ncbi:GNAT family N-acetyltransferase [Streptomyces sp. NPDC093589]|uniref:GNAT family N-acetyltransferase n=1 Tax=Streptomyces sp. NPDC093589 TaxID=3366043 RepID=UPI00381721A5